MNNDDSEGMVMDTLGAYLRASVERHGPRAALLYRPRYRTEIWSYARLWDVSGRVARLLRVRGIERGDRVIIWAPNSPWWVAAFFGCLRLGAIVVPLDMRSSAEYVRRVLEQTEPKLAFLSRLTAAGWDHQAPVQLLEDLDGVLGAPTGDPFDAEVTPDDVAEVVFTSGTTGDPKGVILTHANITANVESAMQVIPTSPDYRLISLLPLSHMFEQTVGLLLPLGCGAGVYYPASRQSTVIFRDLQTQGITTILAVPQALALFMAAIEREVRKQGKEASWRRLQALAAHLPMPARRWLFRGVHRRLGGHLLFLVSGGAPLEPELIRAWELLGLPVLQGYGATEASPIITGTSLGDRRARSVGRAVPGVEITLAEDGEVLARGPNITRGYWNNPSATASAFRDGWYCTGDLGELDADGYLTLRGRKKDLIVLANGQNVYPADVEQALREAGCVLDAVVVGLPAPLGVQVHAVLLRDETLDADALVRRANAMLAAHQQIQGFSLWPEPDFPRTHTLKVKKQEVLRALLERGEQVKAPMPSPTAALGETTEVMRLVAEATGIPAAELRPEAALGEDCGLDSLGRVELLAAIEGDLGVYLDESLVEAGTTLAALDEMVRAQRSGARPDFPRWPLSRTAAMVRAAVQAPAFALLDVLARATVEGSATLEGVETPVLFVANHSSHLDSAVLLRALPAHWRRRLAVAAAADYFFTRRWLGTGVALGLNAFPFSREGNIRPTLEHCAHLLDQGWSILIYPEGTRGGEMAPFKAGAGLLAVELGVPVVPVRLAGMESILPKGRRLPRPGQVRVRFGPPLRFAAGTAYADAAAAMAVAVRAL